MGTPVTSALEYGIIRGNARGDFVTETAREPIRNDRELEFVVFCIENVADAIGKPSDAVYRALTGPGDILNQYIVPSYDVLHTQGRDYIVNDIREVMAERGVRV